MGQQGKKKGKQLGAFKKLMILLLLELAISAVIAPLIIFYGPFTNLKSIAVETLYTTSTKRAIVEFFLSDNAISQILAKQGFYMGLGSQEEVTGKGVNIKVQRSKEIDFAKVEGKDVRLKGYMLVIHDPRSIKVGYSSKMPIEGELTSQIAKRNNAIAAINAGGFEYKTDNNSWFSTGGKCEGFIIHEGKVIKNSLNSDTTPYLAIGFKSDGKLIFGKYSVNKLKSMGVNEAVCSFGPKLIVDGKKMFSRGETGGLGYNPRTAIGQKANGDVIFLVFEGRDIGSLGASVYDLQEIMYDQGVVNAINLDGGSSTSMYFNGKLVNKPSNTLGERAIPSVFMVIPEGGSSK